MGNRGAGDGNGFVGTLISGIVGFSALILAVIAIRENWQITVVLSVLVLLILYLRWAYLFHTRSRPHDILKSPKKNYRKYGGFLMIAPLVVVIFLLILVPGTADYIQIAFVGTPTPTPTLTPTLTPLPASTATSMPTLPVEEESKPETVSQPPTQAACYCQKSTDDLTIQCLISAESQAANEGSLEIISHIFSPSATIFRGNSPQQTWETPTEYYQQLFGDLQFDSASHSGITYAGSMGSTQFYVSGSAGYYQKKSGGAVESYDNEKPSDHWALSKNEQGCWVITYYEFNAAHLAFPRN